MSDESYELRHDTISTNAWKMWTNGGLNLDSYESRQTMQSAQDAATNAYVPGISDDDWLAYTLKRLSRRIFEQFQSTRK
jgi:hypothetical protein